MILVVGLENFLEEEVVVNYRKVIFGAALYETLAQKQTAHLEKKETCLVQLCHQQVSGNQHCHCHCYGIGGSVFE